MDSTIGYRAVLSPGIKVHRSVVRMYGIVKENLYDERFRPGGLPTRGDIIIDEVRSLLFCLLICVSFVPPYESYTFTVSFDQTLSMMLLGVLSSVAVWFLVWLVLALAIQGLAVFLMKHKRKVSHLEDSLYQVLVQVVWLTGRGDIGSC
mmetsp:Transcript_49587/g.73888  ORF Transcript_49587/g.73888 Transcript_49587/m.73888 type:complete len:149 (-) Transcript_49587:620-1066(-)